MEHNKKDENFILSQLHNMSILYQTKDMKIISMLEPLAKKLEQSEQYEDLETLNKIALQCYKSLKLSFCLNEYRKLTSETPTIDNRVFNLNENFYESLISLQLMLSGTEYNLKFNICKEPLILNNDLKHISAALFLLTAYSCENTPAGSEIIVDLDKNETDAIITVSNQSDGLSNEMMAKLYDEAEFCLTYDNIGLNLPLAKKIVESLGGRFIITSKINQGTNIKVTFPLYEQSQNDISFRASGRKYLTNRYSDMQIIMCDICNPTFF